MVWLQHWITLNMIRVYINTEGISHRCSLTGGWFALKNILHLVTTLWAVFKKCWALSLRPPPPPWILWGRCFLCALLCTMHLLVLEIFPDLEIIQFWSVITCVIVGKGYSVTPFLNLPPAICTYQPISNNFPYPQILTQIHHTHPYPLSKPQSISATPFISPQFSINTPIPSISILPSPTMLPIPN